MPRTGDNTKQNIRFRETCCMWAVWNSLTPSKLAPVLTFWPVFGRNWVRKHAGTLTVLMCSCFLRSLRPLNCGHDRFHSNPPSSSFAVPSQNHYGTSGLETSGGTDREVASCLRWLVASANNIYEGCLKSIRPWMFPCSLISVELCITNTHR